MQALQELGPEDWARIESVTIAGGGSLEPIIRSSANDLTQAGRPVTVRGYLSRDEAMLAMLEADYLLIPSRIESVPVVFSDAMKLGLPVVSMPVGDLPQLVTSDTGVLASDLSAPAFATAIRKVLDTNPTQFRLEAMRDRFDIGRAAQAIITTLDPNNHD